MPKYCTTCGTKVADARINSKRLQKIEVINPVRSANVCKKCGDEFLVGCTLPNGLCPTCDEFEKR